MKKLQNLKECICSFENLYAAYEQAAHGKRYREETLAFTYDLEENLLTLREELLNGTYRVGPYREFYVRYPKPRLIMALGFRDRVVQWAIYRQINPYVDKRFIAHSYGCRVGKGTLPAAQTLLGWVRLVSRKADAGDWALIKGDVSKYFYRVDHDTALAAYRRYTEDEWFLALMRTIINNPDVPFGLPPGMRADDCPRERRLYDVGMPIGNLTSQETANIYLDGLDQYCKHVLKLRYYTRYMDDFNILCKRRDAKRILHCVEKYLNRQLRLELSVKSRIGPAVQGCEYVGYRITPVGMRLRRRTIRHIKRSLMHVAGLYALGQMDFGRAMQSVESYRGMTKHCNGHHVRLWIEHSVALQRREK